MNPRHEPDREGLAFLADGGKMGALFRAHDWSSNPLGPPESWPQALKTAVDIMLSSKFPMFAAWGPELIFLYNDSYIDVLGAKHPALGKPFEEIWHEIWDEVGPLAERAIAGEATYHERFPLLMNRKGYDEQTWFTFSYSPLRGDDGAIEGMFCACVEISDIVRAELAVRESEERFRLIADSAPVPMWVTKLDRKRSFVNRAYVDFFGVSYEDCVDFDWRTIIHPEDRDRIVAESAAGEAALKQFVLEGRYRRADGEWRWMRSESQPRLGPGGEHIGFIGVAHDVTEAREGAAALRRMNETLEKRVAERTADLTAALDRLQAEVGERLRAEEALRQAQKMEAVGRLTGGIAHDFNNLLTPIMGGLEIIAAAESDPRLRRLAEAALDSSRRGAKLTGQLLAFSRLQRIEMAPVAVNEVIERMHSLLRHTIGHSVRIETRLDPQAGHGCSDPNQLENAILNLAINARDAMPDGGILTISTGRETVERGPDPAPGEYVRVSVTDSGHGMKPEVAARAIEPFFSTKPIGSGTGLGLAQVYGIARQSGGTIRLETEEGRGTSVHLLLPATAPPSPAEPGESADRPAPAHAPGAARILVIDDDDDVRLFLAGSLESLGHEVISAASGEEGLGRILADGPDLALIDYAMPGMTGADVARAARARRPDLPIVFVTGYAESDQLEDALGPDVPVLRKPFTMADLTSALEANLPVKARAKTGVPTS
ncbi:MAG TPA: PAS domain S-box protein [Allosphingosinicella sp.]